MATTLAGTVVLVALLGSVGAAALAVPMMGGAAMGGGNGMMGDPGAMGGAMGPHGHDGDHGEGHAMAGAHGHCGCCVGHGDRGDG